LLRKPELRAKRTTTAVLTATIAAAATSALAVAAAYITDLPG